MTTSEANDARQSAQRNSGTALSIEKCNRCGCYHLTFAHRLSPRERDILRDLAFGFRAEEIMKERKLSQDQVYRTVLRLCHTVGAFSRSHLIAVAVQIGVVSIFD